MNTFAGNALVVDDDPLVRLNHVDLLEEHGYACTEAESVAQAVALCDHRGFDVVVCDHDLGDAKGLDLLAWLAVRRLAFPVVYLTAAPAAVAAAAGAFANVKAVLAKPVDPAALLAALGAAPERGPASAAAYPKLIGAAEREMLLDGFN